MNPEEDWCERYVTGDDGLPCQTVNSLQVPGSVVSNRTIERNSQDRLNKTVSYDDSLEGNLNILDFK